MNKTNEMNSYFILKERLEQMRKQNKQHATINQMEQLMRLAQENDITVQFLPFKAYYGRLEVVNGNMKIGIKMDMSFDEYVYNIAHELAHYFLHYDKGDTIKSSKHDEYEEQADRAAKMLLAALSVEQKSGSINENDLVPVYETNTGGNE